MMWRSGEDDVRDAYQDKSVWRSVASAYPLENKAWCICMYVFYLFIYRIIICNLIWTFISSHRILRGRLIFFLILVFDHELFHCLDACKWTSLLFMHPSANSAPQYLPTFLFPTSLQWLQPDRVVIFALYHVSRS